MSKLTEELHQKYANLRHLKHFTGAHAMTPWLSDNDAKHNRKLCASLEEAVKPVSYTHLTLPTICSV